MNASRFHEKNLRSFWNTSSNGILSLDKASKRSLQNASTYFFTIFS